MRIFVLDDSRSDLATLRLGRVEALANAALAALPPGDGRFAFAGWTLDAATRNLWNAAGRRADLTSSEFDLLVGRDRRFRAPS